MEYEYRFFVNDFANAVSTIKVDGANGYPPVPAVGNVVYLEPETYLAYRNREPDWTEADLDFDKYEVVRVEYEYAQKFVMIDIFLEGQYIDYEEEYEDED